MRNTNTFYIARLAMGAVAVIVAVFIAGCKKTDDPNPGKDPSDTTKVDTTGFEVPVTPGVMGLFLENWSPKTYTAPSFTETAKPTTTANAIVTVDVNAVVTKIPSTMFGHNANTWMTSMVDQSDFMSQIKALNPHVLRFPAGSGSDAYFWNAAPGGLPSDVPTQLVDKDGNLKDPGYMYGNTNDNWRASLDNYYSVLEATNSVGLLTMNYGYARYGTSNNPVAAAAHLAADWVRYDKGRTKYWEIGNEVYADWEWGYRINTGNNKDGQPEYINGKLYAQHVKVYCDSMRKAASEVGATIYIGAVMYESEPQSWQANSFKTWNQTMIPEVGDAVDFYIGHNYFTPYNQNSTSSVILDAALTQPAIMMNYMTKQLTDNGGTIKPIAMTEYNMWASGSKQQVSNVSGMFASIVVCEAIANKFALTARWDLLNSWNNGDDHGLFSDGQEPTVSRWTARPSYYYLYYLQKCMGDRFVMAKVGQSNTSVKAYASTFDSGEANVTLINTSSTAQTVEVKFRNFTAGGRYYWYTLEGSNDNGEFSRKVLINGNGPTGVAGGPTFFQSIKAKSATTTGGILVKVPALGMATVMIDK